MSHSYFSHKTDNQSPIVACTTLVFHSNSYFSHKIDSQSPVIACTTLAFPSNYQYRSESNLLIRFSIKNTTRKARTLVGLV